VVLIGEIRTSVLCEIMSVINFTELLWL